MEDRMIRRLLLALCLALLPLSPAAASLSNKGEGVFDPHAAAREVASILHAKRIPGAQVVVLLPDGRDWTRNFGVRDLKSAEPMDGNTLVQVGSVTKILTASLIADLVARKKIDWNDRLRDVLPGVAMRPDIGAMTIDQLLTHTSRLPGNPPNRIDVDGVMQPYSRKELYAALIDPAVKLAPPGRTYSNWGYALLGYIVETKAGKPFEQVLRERILTPLAMNDSSVALSAADERRLATHYWPDDNPLIPRPRWVFGEIAGFGGMTSTASDIAKFLRYQISPEKFPNILDADAVLALRLPQTLSANGVSAGARGWNVVRTRDGTVFIEKDGEVDGQTAYIGFSPFHRVGVAVVANLGESGARDVALPLLRRAVEAARQRATIDREQALLLARNRHWADADAALSAIVAANPRDGLAWYQLGVARYQLFDLPGATTALTRAAGVPEHAAASRLLLAAIGAARGDCETALDLVEQVVKDPKFDRSELARPEFRILQGEQRWIAMTK